jgi:hypothetical protein
MKKNKPTIFISCGQTKASREERIAHKIKKRLKSKYDPYIAVEEQTTKGLLNNVFNKISNSEYFLFIDFRRRKQHSSSSDRSIYANQELAIAGYLDIDTIIAFQEKGLEPEGMQKAAMQLNPTIFTLGNEDEFVKDVCKEVNSKWSSNWKNKLDITEIVIHNDVPKIITEIENNVRKVYRGEAKHYSLRVSNLHKSKDAINCFGYIDSIYDLDKGSKIKTNLVEIKWEGTIIPNIKILHQNSRGLDAFYYFKNNPTTIWFSSFNDSPFNLQPISTTKNIKITYSVTSDNFHKTSKEVFLNFINGDWEAHF